MRLRELISGVLLATAAAMFSLSPALAQESTGGQNVQGKTGGEAINLVTAWEYGPLYSKGVSVERLLGADVYDVSENEAGEKEVAALEEEAIGEADEEIIGEVENFAVNPEGFVTDIIIETGGFLDIGDTHLLYPFDKARIVSVDKIYVEIRENAIEEYSLFPVVDENPLAGRRWRVTELINDYAALGAEVPYGVVEDVIINQKGKVLAVVVQPDVRYAYGGYYAWPYYGYEYGFDPGLPYYSVPYTEQEVADLAAFEYAALETATEAPAKAGNAAADGRGANTTTGNGGSQN